MIAGQSLGLYLGLMIAGLGFILLVWLLLRLVPQFRPTVIESGRRSNNLKIQMHNDAAMIIQPGGRIFYINLVAQEWFGLVEGELPHLERLALRVRPSENFLEICAMEGQARFSINGRMVDARSYAMPGYEGSILLTMQRSDSSLGMAESGVETFSSSALKTVAEFSQGVSAELTFDAALHSIFNNLEKIVPADFLEIKIRDVADGSFLTYRMAGPTGAARDLQADRDTQFGGYSRLVIEKRASLIIPDTRVINAPRFDPAGIIVAPMGSYAGIPLLSGEDMLGVLEIGVIPTNGFSSEEINILQLLSGQIAVAIRNIRLYESQQKWTSQLLGLTSLTQTVSSLREVRELFSRLVSGLAPLFEVNILGFLLYDEQRRVLEGQVPFHGLSNQFVQIYKTYVRPNSLAEKRVLSQDIIAASSAADDLVWADLGLQDLARAASMRDTWLIPLVSSGRFLGYLQLSNHKQGRENMLSPDELRLLNVVVNQVSAIVENALLVQQARQRNQRSEGLRRIASLVSSPATLDEVLRYSLQEVSQILTADASAIFLVDEQEGVMCAHLPSVHGVPEDVKDSLARLYVRPSAVHLTVAGSQRPFISGSLTKDHKVLGIYRPIVRKMQIDSAIVVPLVVRGRGIGELMLSARRADAFTNYDVQIASTVASQLAVAIETNRISGHTSESLLRRAELSTTMARISRELNVTTGLRELLRLIYDESLKITQADCGTVVIYSHSDKISSSDGVELSPRVFLGHAASADSESALKRVMVEDEPVVVTTEEYSTHPGVALILLVPIAYQGERLGYIEMHSSNADRFDDIVSDALKMLSVQAAIALVNAFQHRALQKRLSILRHRANTLSNLFETASLLRVDESLENALHTIATGIQQSTPFNVVLVSLFDQDTGLLQRIAGVGLPEETLVAVKAHRQPWGSVSQLMKPEFKVGNLYFIPFDQSPVIPADVQMVTVSDMVQAEAPNAWNPDDLLLLPIYDREGQPLGIISVDAPRDGVRPSAAIFETLEVFAAQAALTIASGKRILDYVGEIKLLSEDVTRQKNLVNFSQRSLPMFLRKDMEQTIAIGKLYQRAQHVRAGLQLTEAVSRQMDMSSALLTLAQQILASFDMSVSLLARETLEGPRITNVFGNLTRGANPEAMFGQRNPLRTCLQTGETILSPSLEEDEVWHDTPFLTALRAKSFICIPIIINGKPVAAVLATDTQPLIGLRDEERQFYFQISRQISIILQNITLLSETRQRLQEVNLLLDFSRRLSGLAPQEILQSLLDSALRVVSSAEAGVVLMWEPREERLVPQAAANYVDMPSILDISYRMGEGLPGRVFAEKQTRRLNEVNFALDYNLPADNLLKYRKATGGRLPVSSMLIPVRTSERELGVVILDNFRIPAAFRADDEAILLSLTQQVALSLENVRLVQATQERAGQLQALNAVAATISSSLNREELIASLLERFKAVIPYDTAILWLREHERMVIAETDGFGDTEQRRGLSVNVQDSQLLNEMLRAGHPIFVPDVRQDARFPSLVEAERLSWLGVPLLSKGQVLGVIAIEKQEADFYSSEQMQLTTTFASQAAIALENANLFEESVRRAAELDERSQRLAILNRFSSALSSALTADQILSLTATQLLDALQSQRALVITVDRRDRAFLLSVLPEESNRPPIYRALPEAPVLAQLRENQSVYVSENITKDGALTPLLDFMEGMQSLIILPVSTNQSLYAIILQTVERHRFVSSEIELARTFGNQAGIALESADLYQSTLTTAERLSIINQVSSQISATLDPEEIYQAVHDAVSQLMPVDAFIIALHDEIANEVDGAYIMDMGQRITGVRLPYGQGLSGRVIATGESILTLEHAEAEASGAVTLGDSPPSIVAVPMLSGSRVVGMLSAQSYKFNAYDEKDVELLSILANQATVAVQNGRLFAETQQFAVTLEQRVVERTAELEREKRNTETLLRILTEVSASLDLDRALNRTLALLNDALGSEQGTIMLVHAEDNMLHYRAGYGYVSENMEQVVLRPASQLKLKIGEGLAGWVVKNRQSALVDDLYQDSRWIISKGSQQHRSAIAAPLVVGEDIIGAIMVFHRNPAYFNYAALEMVQAIGSQVAISISNAQLYELIRDQAERLGSMLRGQQMEASRQQAILEAVADGVLVTDPANRITFINASIGKILDLDRVQLQNRPIEHFSGLFGKTTQAWTNTIKDWAENPGEHGAGEMYAEQISLDNGRVVLVHLAPIIWHTEFLGTVSIFRDITHEVEVDRLKSEFVTTVSHELRTPMTAIRGYVDVMLMGAAGALTESQSHFLEIVKSNTDRLNILVNDLLDISRIESGRVILSLQSVDLQEVASEVVAEASRRTHDEQKPMDVTWQAENNLPRVLADPERIRQVLANLVDNAFNYTPANGKIKIQLHRVNGDVQVDVRDNGIGVDPEQQPRLFERFFRGEDPLVLATPGTGLGLPIVKQLVEMHNGKIWMESQGTGYGSTFSFTVPAEIAEE